MKNDKLLLKIIIIFIVLFSFEDGYAQLGFCNGNSGDPIFTETFGTGTTQTPLPAGTTTYTFSSATPNDGFYTVSSSTAFFDWHDVPDHTEGDTNGKCLIVNADFTAGEFYRTTITGLCENTSYEFSAFLINLSRDTGCGGNNIPINVRFEIWDDTDTTLLASGDTGEINAQATPNWEQYALVFQTLPAQTEVILKMRNNGVGGCGNDLAIDDIVFKSCGDNVTIEDTSNESDVFICETQTPYNLNLQANPDGAIFNTYAYQWETSTDGINWTEIVGETNQNLNINVNTTSLYRVKVAEDAINLANALCNVISDEFSITIISTPLAPVSNGDVTICENENEPLEVTVPTDVTVNWYDAISGGNLLEENNISFLPENEGVYYAEAISINGNCISNTRTAVTLTFSQSPQVFDEAVFFCQDESVEISANINNVSYLWNTGETTESITVSAEGIYTVDVTNLDGCTVTKTIEVTQLDAPIIAEVYTENNDLIITTENVGDFSYSIDGINYQNSPVFENLEGGRYTVYVRENSDCGIDTQTFIHFTVPKFFTPNNDTYHDTWRLKGIEFYASSEVQIFDRYGKLLFYRKNKPISWDGMLRKQPLPTSDYWYVIIINGQRRVGHFTLKR
ncbi:T9SS type B sorting domain-containing protein [Mesoflavibacter zeaxanthinifaciens]|uniref:T9SS type B sorting domain-containing protein n=1 Tax=Mesoflavibacter zeaxanthinifaciens TaxID=393060 RepID=UPI003A8F3804